MGFMDKVKQAAKGRSAMVEKGIDLAVTQVNKRTGGKYQATLTKRANDMKDRARKLDDERPDRRPDGPEGETPRPPA